MSYCWNRFHAAALRIAWHNGWRAALGRDACNLGEQALAERTARRFALQGGRDAIGSKTEEQANS